MGGFLSSDDMQDDASDRIRFLLNYLEMVKIGPKIFLAHFVRFFVYALLHLMSLAKRNTLLRYMCLVSFISIAFVVAKLKFFGLIRHA